MKKIKRTRILVRHTEITAVADGAIAEHGITQCPLCHTVLGEQPRAIRTADTPMLTGRTEIITAEHHGTCDQ